MAIPKHVQALANHKGAAIVHAGGMLIPVKILDIESESSPISDTTTFKAMVVNPDCLSTTELTKAAKTAANSMYGREGAFPSTRYGHPDARKDEVVGLNAAAAYYAAYKKAPGPFEIDRVIFNNPATIVFWKDGTKTVVKCQEGDTYSPESGLAIAIAKKALGNKSNFNEVFKKHIPNY